jgi:hypothetical protein
MPMTAGWLGTSNRICCASAGRGAHASKDATKVPGHLAQITNFLLSRKNQCADFTQGDAGDL